MSLNIERRDGGTKRYLVFCACMLSCFSLSASLQPPWTVACQASLTMGFSKQEYWSRLPCPPPGDFLDSGIEPASLTSPALAGGFFTTNASWEGFRDMMK